MKRRGFLGLLTGLPFVGKVEPKFPKQTWIKDGTNPTSPAFSFSNDTNTGFYRCSAELVSVTVAAHAGKIADNISKDNRLLESLRSRVL